MKTQIALSTTQNKVTAAAAKETAKLVKESIEHQHEILRSLESQKNHPQVIPIYAKVQGVIETLEAVDKSLVGKTAYLRVLTHD